MTSEPARSGLAFRVPRHRSSVFVVSLSPTAIGAGQERKRITGALGGIRTPNLKIRSLALYPVELREHLVGLSATTSLSVTGLLSADQ